MQTINADQLAKTLMEMGVAASGTQIKQLNDYAALVARWNKHINLVSRQDMYRFVDRHLLQSVSLVPRLGSQLVLEDTVVGSTSKRLLDIGTGAGLPGLPIGICCPTLQVGLIDRSAKKVRFLTHAITELGLDNTRARCEDIEQQADSSADDAVDAIVSRAVEPPAQLWTRIRHLLKPGGYFWGFETLQQTADQSSQSDYSGAHSVAHVHLSVGNPNIEHRIVEVKAK